jgi:uncharacterized protein
MRHLALWILLLIVTWYLAACGEAVAEPASLPTAAETIGLDSGRAAPTATPTAAPSGHGGGATLLADAGTSIPSPQPTSSPTATPSPEPAPTASPDPYQGLSIEELAARRYGGGQLEIVDTMESNDAFTRYLITYPSDGLTIYGYMNVPNEGSRFPVVVVLHGYVQPEAYQTVAYTERYADNLAEAGYMVIHPNLRNHPPSDPGPNPFRVGYAIDVLNLIAIIRQQSQDPLGYLRRADPDRIYLWGHSMGGGVAMRVMAVDNSPYLRAAVLYGSMSGDERLNFERIRQWSGGSSGDFELQASSQVLRAVSPVAHLERIRAAVSIHYSLADDVVPPAWSEDLCRLLQARSHPVECHAYEGLPHTFVGRGDALFMEQVVDFFGRH